MHCVFSDLSFGVLGISKFVFPLSVLIADYFMKCTCLIYAFKKEKVGIDYWLLEENQVQF